MNDDKWEEVRENIKSKFEVLNEETEDIIYEDPITGKKKEIGEKEILEFSSPMGELRIEREKKLLVQDRKHHYHKTRTDAVVQLVFSENEYGDKMKVFKREGERWIEMDGEGIL